MTAGETARRRFQNHQLTSISMLARAGRGFWGEEPVTSYQVFRRLLRAHCKRVERRSDIKTASTASILYEEGLCFVVMVPLLVVGIRKRSLVVKVGLDEDKFLGFRRRVFWLNSHRCAWCWFWYCFQMEDNSGFILMEDSRNSVDSIVACEKRVERGCAVLSLWMLTVDDDFSGFWRWFAICLRVKSRQPALYCESRVLKWMTRGTCSVIFRWKWIFFVFATTPSLGYRYNNRLVWFLLIDFLKPATSACDFPYALLH